MFLINRNIISKMKRSKVSDYAALREVDFLTDSGKVFHSRGSEEENEPSYIALFDLGTASEPLVVDLSVR